MTSLSLAPRFALSDLVVRVFQRRASPRQTADSRSDAEASRERRAFIMEKLADNAEAFASEYDMQTMLAHYPRNF